MNAEWVGILVCPETRQPLRPVTGEALAALNGRVASGQLTNRAGHPVIEVLEGGLAREDGRVVYPVRGGIPILLTGEGIEL